MAEERRPAKGRRLPRCRQRALRALRARSFIVTTRRAQRLLRLWMLGLALVGETSRGRAREAEAAGHTTRTVATGRDKHAHARCLNSVSACQPCIVMHGAAAVPIHLLL